MAIIEKNMRRRAARPLFKPRAQLVYVVVRPTRVASNAVLPPGTELKFGEYPRFRLKSLYQRRRIGAKGDAWTEYMLEAWDRRNDQREVPVEEGPPKGEDLEVITTKEGSTNVHQIKVGGRVIRILRGNKARDEFLQALQTMG